MLQVLIYTAGAVSLVNLLWFAWQVWSEQVPPTNIASWLMWVMLDLVILGATILTGEPYILVLSYTVGASAVLLVHFLKGTWKWTWAESASAVGATVSAYLSFTLSGEAGVIAGVCSMYIAAVPITRDLWKAPNPGTFSMFAVTAVCCLLTLVATWPWTVGGSLLPGAGMIYNGAMAVVAVVKK